MKKNNILIIKHGAFGDLIQADGIIKSIKMHHKNSNIVLLTSTLYLNLMDKCPYIDEIFTDDRHPFFNVAYYVNFYKKIRKKNFSKIYDLQNSYRTYIYRIYFFYKIKWVSTNRENHKKSGLQGLKEMLIKNNIEAKHLIKSNISWLATDVRGLLKKNKISSNYLILLPGSSKKNSLKRWPYFKKLAQVLIIKNYEVVVVLGPEELELKDSIPGHIMKNLNWSQLAGIIKKSSYVIGNDSGPCHLASNLNKSGLAIFGPATSPERAEIKKGKFDFIKVKDLFKLSPDEVFKKMKKMKKMKKYSI